MVDVQIATDRANFGWGRFSRRDLILFSFSAVIGLFLWKSTEDWFLGALALFSFWIVLGLAAQSRDIWQNLRRRGNLASDLSPDERWGLRFAVAWRIAVCFLIGLCLLVRLLVGFHVLAMNDGQDFVVVSTQDMWTAVLLCSIIIAIIASRGTARHDWRRPWSWAVYVFRGFVAGILLMLILEDRQIVFYLVHLTITGILAALQSPCGYVPDIAKEMTEAASRTRVTLFFDIASAGAVSVLVNCILAWQLSVHWRAGRWQRAGLGVLLATGIAVMVLIAARIVFVEIPTISPVMVDYVSMPSPLRLAAAVVLALGLAAFVARRWAEPPAVGVAPNLATWRRDTWRYYHERLILILPLGGIAIAEFFALGYKLRYILDFDWWRDVETALWVILSPNLFLPLLLVFLVVQAVYSKWSKSSEAIATDQPRLSPGLFLTLWLSLLLIIVCSVPLLGAWHFASFLRAGYFSG